MKEQGTQGLFVLSFIEGVCSQEEVAWGLQSMLLATVADARNIEAERNSVLL